MFERITKQLSGKPDYDGQVRARFDNLLLRLVKFLHDRRESQSNRREYLGPFRDGVPWLEIQLQDDLHDFLISAGFSEIEKSTAGGRADIFIRQPDFRFVIEVKRLLSEWNESELEPLLGQAGAYEATDVRLGVLAVLDITDRKPGQPHFNKCMEVREIVYAGDDDRRTVVFMRVLGNRKVPSQIKKTRKAKLKNATQAGA
jgi:hypothetical protein